METSSLKQLLPIAAAFALVGWLAIFAYGFLYFPDAPYAPCPEHGFCGKTQLAHTQAEYDAFKRWELGLIASVPVAAISAFYLNRRRRRKEPAA